MTACWSLRMPAAKGAQADVAVSFDGGEPGFQVAAAGAGGHHLGEGGYVPGGRVDVRAAGADGLDLSLLVWLEVVGAGQQPAGDLAGLRDCRGRGGRGECLAEWPDVAADGLLAAGPAAVRYAGWRWLIRARRAGASICDRGHGYHLCGCVAPTPPALDQHQPLGAHSAEPEYIAQLLGSVGRELRAVLCRKRSGYPQSGISRGYGPGHMPTTCTSPSLSPPHSGQRTSA